MAVRVQRPAQAVQAGQPRVQHQLVQAQAIRDQLVLTMHHQDQHIPHLYKALPHHQVAAVREVKVVVHHQEVVVAHHQAEADQLEEAVNNLT